MTVWKLSMCCLQWPVWECLQCLLTQYTYLSKPSFLYTRIKFTKLKCTQFQPQWPGLSFGAKIIQIGPLQASQSQCGCKMEKIIKIYAKNAISQKRSHSLHFFRYWSETFRISTLHVDLVFLKFIDHYDDYFLRY